MTFNIKGEKQTVAAIPVIDLISKHGKVSEHAFKAWFWTYNKMYVQNQALYVQNQAFLFFGIRDVYEYIFLNISLYIIQ